MKAPTKDELIEALIYNYLDDNGYKHTMFTFNQETSITMDRNIPFGL